MGSVLCVVGEGKSEEFVVLNGGKGKKECRGAFETGQWKLKCEKTALAGYLPKRKAERGTYHRLNI